MHDRITRSGAVRTFNHNSVRITYLRDSICYIVAALYNTRDAYYNAYNIMIDEI